jgi:probable HAF family extracellular repeat protein
MSFHINRLHREKRWSAAGLTSTIGKGEGVRRLGFFSYLRQEITEDQPRWARLRLVGITMQQLIKITLFWLIFSATTLFATNYRFTKIDVPGEPYTTANGINARGDIVGGYVDVNGVGHGFSLREGVFSTVDFPNASFTLARAINARGDIAGRFLDINGNYHAFLLRDGQFTQIDYPGAAATVGRGINNAGDVTGNHIDSAGTESGFILKDGTFHDVRVPHSFSTDVFMAEDNGRVMVGDAVMEFDAALHGYVRSKAGNFQLIDFPGLSAPCTGPRWINERGDIVGLFAYVNTGDDCFAGPPLHGFLLRQGKYVSIDFPGSTSSVVLAINDDGQIVGWYTDKDGNTHGFKGEPKDTQ